jgi:hypothetical protein
MSARWKQFAESTAERWAAPRVGGHPPGMSLDVLAEHTLYHAQLVGFAGDLTAWTCELHALAGQPQARRLMRPDERSSLALSVQDTLRAPLEGRSEALPRGRSMRDAGRRPDGRR